MPRRSDIGALATRCCCRRGPECLRDYAGRERRQASPRIPASSGLRRPLPRPPGRNASRAMHPAPLASRIQPPLSSASCTCRAHPVGVHASLVDRLRLAGIAARREVPIPRAEYPALDHYLDEEHPEGRSGDRVRCSCHVRESPQDPRHDSDDVVDDVRER